MAEIPKIRLKAEIPEALKAELAPTKWGRTLTLTPVVMTVIATMLAGLSSSEMTRAQYDRSLAAQQQSKAGDQWSFFQAKKLRGAMQRSTLDVLQSTIQVRPLESVALNQPDQADAAALAALRTGELPEPPALTLDLKVQAALEAVENSRPETEIAALLAPV